MTLHNPTLKIKDLVEDQELDGLAMRSIVGGRRSIRRFTPAARGGLERLISPEPQALPGDTPFARLLTDE